LFGLFYLEGRATHGSVRNPNCEVKIERATWSGVRSRSVRREVAWGPRRWTAFHLSFR